MSASFESSRSFSTSRTNPLLVLGWILALPLLAHAQRDLRDIPDPDPELERKTFIVPEGVEVNLYAADPQIAKPIQMNFDAEGRLWIASSEIYPHIKPGQQANDKILIVEDKDGDGTADSTTVFADGLLIPTGVVPGDGGAYVANSTELIHLADTDDDGQADLRRIVLSGFGAEDTHHLLHTLRWGHDGMLYMNQSIYIHSHIETPYGVRHLNGGGIWQFRPETMQLDILCRGFVNPWGHHFDRWGQSFATDGAYGEGINYVFPGSIFVTAPGEKRRLLGLNPGSPKHCGLEILSGRHIPPDWQGNMITNDFRAHRVCRFVVTEDGSGYASRQETELIKSTHVAFRPIDVKQGPDGAIYIADWYNPIIQHGEVDFRDPRRDHVHGRIWRVTFKGRPLVEPTKLTSATIDELLEQLKASEDWTRLWAKRILKTRDAAVVAKSARTWVENLDPADPQYDHQRLEALWLTQSILAVDQELLNELLSSEDHRVRAAALRVASETMGQSPQAQAIFAAAARDNHPRVRLEAVRALAEQDNSRAAELAAAALDQPMDRFLDFALWQTMRDLAPYWLPAVQAGKLDFSGDADHLTFALRAVESPGVVQPLMKLVEQGNLDSQREESMLSMIAALGQPPELQKVFELALDDKRPAESRGRLLAALVDASLQRKVKPAGDLNRLSKLVGHDDDALASAAVRAIGAWKLDNLRDDVVQTAKDAKLSQTRREAAFEALRLLGDGDAIAALKQLAGFNDSHWQRQQAIAALVPLDPAAAAEEAVHVLGVMPLQDVQPQAVVRPFTQHKAGPAALIAALGEKELNPDVAKLCIRAVRTSGSPAPELIEAFRAAGKLAESGWKLTPELKDELVKAVADEGDPHRGEAVYRRTELQCIKCHAIGGAGGRVGPDLVSIGASAQVDYLIESLIEPNAKVKENFHSLQVLDLDGRVSTGIPVSRADGVLVLRDAEDNEIRIPESDIDQERDGRSLMPDGSVDELTREELVDLVRFMSELGKVGEFAVGNAQVVRRWETLVWTQDGHNRLNRTSFDSAATDDPAFTWRSAYSKVSGELPLTGLAEFVPFRDQSPTSVVRFDLDVTAPGDVRINFSDTDGMSLWIDGKPRPIDATIDLPLDRGSHRLTLTIDHARRTAPLHVELLDHATSTAQAQIVGGK